MGRNPIGCPERLKGGGKGARILLDMFPYIRPLVSLPCDSRTRSAARTPLCQPCCLRERTHKYKYVCLDSLYRYPVFILLDTYIGTYAYAEAPNAASKRLPWLPQGIQKRLMCRRSSRRPAARLHTINPCNLCKTAWSTREYRRGLVRYAVRS
jgi:hypothetical protein